MKINLKAVILSEASAGFADAESKDPYSPNSAMPSKGFPAVFSCNPDFAYEVVHAIQQPTL